MCGRGGPWLGGCPAQGPRPSHAGEGVGTEGPWAGWTNGGELHQNASKPKIHPPLPPRSQTRTSWADHVQDTTCQSLSPPPLNAALRNAFCCDFHVEVERWPSSGGRATWHSSAHCTTPACDIVPVLLADGQKFLVIDPPPPCPAASRGICHPGWLVLPRLTCRPGQTTTTVAWDWAGPKLSWKQLKVAKVWGGVGNTVRRCLVGQLGGFGRAGGGMARGN